SRGSAVARGDDDAEREQRYGDLTHAGSVDLGAPPGGRALDLVDLPASLEITKMRERLRERETLLVRRSKDREERAAHGVRVAVRVADRIEGRAKPVLVMSED